MMTRQKLVGTGFEGKCQNGKLGPICQDLIETRFRFFEVGGNSCLETQSSKAEQEMSNPNRPTLQTGLERAVFALLTNS